jgi:nucleotide-binding universal stress UspA family protein
MKNTPNKIAVAVDFSPFSKHAVSYAADLALLLDKPLVLINVIDQRGLERLKRWSPEVGTGNGDRFIKGRTREREKRLEAMAAETRKCDIPTETQVRVDVPFRGVLAGVKQSNADLLIICTKGRTNLNDVLVGSCAEKLFRRSPVPVLSIPAIYINSRGVTDG